MKPVSYTHLDVYKRQVYMLLTSSVLSTTSKQCFEQPAASFLVCSLIFIEYKEHALACLLYTSFTKNIVGDEGTVDLLIGAGSEPHEYELSAKGRAMIQDSDVFVYENENMETWVPNLLKSMKDKKTKVIDATKGMVLLLSLIHI